MEERRDFVEHRPPLNNTRDSAASASHSDASQDDDAPASSESRPLVEHLPEKIKPRRSSYPPQLDSVQLEDLVNAIKDYQLTHHSLLKLVRSTTPHSILARPIGVSLFPTRFPRRCFDEVVALQEPLNALYAAISSDADWLWENIIKPLVGEAGDEFAECLWEIWEEAHEERKEEGWENDELVLGLFRSDYMLQAFQPASNDLQRCEIKQVEFNTFDCAGAVHANVAADMHRYLARTYANIPPTPSASQPFLPTAHNTANLVRALAAAHTAYGPPRSASASQTGILMLVQPFNINIADERPLEHALWDAGIPCHRLTWGAPFLALTSLSPPTGRSRSALLYHHPYGPQPPAPLEISVVYHRAGIDPDEYDPPGRACRLRAERSAAVKVPSVLGHIAGFKRVQQVLADGGDAMLARFVPDGGTRARVLRSWTRFLPVDEVMGEDEAEGFVLKPCLEGGGNNVHGREIPAFLREVKRDKGKEAWGRFTLQERIRPPAGVENVLISPKGWYEGPVVSELGILGCVLWRERREGREGQGEDRGQVEILENFQAGFTFKCKDEDVDEMSVVKGYSSFDCSNLV